MARALRWLVVSLAAAACNGSIETNDVPPPNFRLVLHDAPRDDVDQVWITFDEISVHKEDEGWLVIDSDVHVVDLKALTGGATETLALTTLAPGVYKEVRLHIVESHVVAGGMQYDLDIPSGDTSGLKLKVEFEVPECGQILVSLDWDLAAHLTGNVGRGFKLRPTIKADTSYDDSTCCPDPPCTALGTCYVTVRAAETDRDVAAAVEAGICSIVDELPASNPQTRSSPMLAPAPDREEGVARGGGDGDADGVPDSLELALARRFYPNLNLHFEPFFLGAANADRSMFYGDATYGPGTQGHVAFAARLWGGGDWPACPNGVNRCIEIRYTLAHNWDLGDDIIPFTAHRGDSEFYSVLVQRAAGTTWESARNDPGVWFRIMDFMAAHKCSIGDSSRFRWSSPSGGPATVWIAEGKHGGYPTQSACNAGGALDSDDCTDNRVSIPRNTGELTNAGAPDAPLDPFIPYPGACRMCSLGGPYDIWNTTQGFANSSAYGKHMRGCLWWDAGSYGCEICPYGGNPGGGGGGCAATGDACGAAPDGCFCDPACIEYGDCCPDACSACGVCPAACGDGECTGTEDACCPADCPTSCGDGTCSVGEDCTTCPLDCPDCDATPSCGGGCAETGGECGQAPSGCWCDPACVNFKDCCPDSCGVCGVCPPACGDGTCAPGVEDNCTCPSDCPPVCGNGTCDCQESSENCPSECGCAALGGVCGGIAPDGCFCDAACVGAADCCADACSVCGHCQPCGDGICAPFVEDNCNCPSDCPPVCGNGVCDCEETAASCPPECGCGATGGQCGQAPDECWCDFACTGLGDCCPDACATCGSCGGGPGPGCGDGVCAPFVEDNCTCPADCPPVCGNGSCDCSENCVGCPGDCGACPPGCGDGTCAPFIEDCQVCPPDCPCPGGSSCSAGVCVSGPSCGDGSCNGGEHCGSCPDDCGPCPAGCGDGTCAPFIEDACNCLVDCPPVCGNGVCDCEEDCTTCPSECGACAPVCGDGTCAPFVEDACNCLVDCPPVCGNGVCDCEEDCLSCPSECGACPFCGDGICEFFESCFSCPDDCGPAPCSP